MIFDYPTQYRQFRFAGCRDVESDERVDDRFCDTSDDLRFATSADASVELGMFSLGAGYRALSAPGPFAVVGFAKGGFGGKGPQFRFSAGPEAVSLTVRATVGGW